MSEYYCLNCHEFTEYNLEGEGNGSAGYYCSNCGMRVYSKCSESVLNDLKKHHFEYPFVYKTCLPHDIMGCKLNKCPYNKEK